MVSTPREGAEAQKVFTFFVRIYKRVVPSRGTDMALTWKDLLTTILALVIGIFAYLMVKGYQFPLISGYRWATLVLLVLGISMCALSSAGPGAGGPFIAIASTLGIITLILIILGFIFGNQLIFIATAASIILLWVLPPSGIL